jgi:ribonuclease HI
MVHAQEIQALVVGELFLSVMIIKKKYLGYSKMTTNNIMEITAVLEAVKLLKFPCDITIYSDSAYVVNSFKQRWIYNWQKNNWKTADKKPVKNKELWEELYNELIKHKFEFVKVKGHSDNELNNRCDYLATNEIKKHS